MAASPEKGEFVPYVIRDGDGRVEAIFRHAPEGAAEELPSTHPDVLRFLFGPDPGATAKGLWIENDLAMARVLEDLIDILLARRLIEFTDLPIMAQQKVVNRHGRRDDIAYVARLFPRVSEDELGD